MLGLDGEPVSCLELIMWGQVFQPQVKLVELTESYTEKSKQKDKQKREQRKLVTWLS